MTDFAAAVKSARGEEDDDAAPCGEDEAAFDPMTILPLITPDDDGPLDVVATSGLMVTVAHLDGECNEW